jgi:hypothetical protein
MLDRGTAVGRRTAVLVVILVIVVAAVGLTLANQEVSCCAMTLNENPGGSTSLTSSTTSLPATTSHSSTSQSQTTPTTTSSSCSGYPPGGNCPGTYSYTFTISVNYTGPWKLTYLGYNNLGKTNPSNVSGSYSGSGFFAKNVTMTSVDTGGLTLCATAQKLDASTATLILTVTGYNETSAPYGSTSYCGGVVP